MKKIKSLLSLVLAVMFVFMLAACDKPQPIDTQPTESPNNEQSNNEQQPGQSDVTETPTPAVRENEERYGGDFKIATSSISNTMDPHYSAGAQANLQWMQYIYETAICMGADGQFYPLICDFDYSDDGLTLVLTVRDYCFSNGEQVTIEDVIASYERAAAIGGSFATKVWDYVTDVKVEGDSATLTFSEMNAVSLQEMADVRGPAWIMPKSIIDKVGQEQIMDPADVIGTGCYTLTTYKPDSEISLARNENYVVTDFGGNGPAAARHAYFDTITFCINTDSASITAGMINGDYSLGGISTDMVPLAQEAGLVRKLLANEWTHAIFFNLSDANADSIVQNVNFRKAVRAAIDCEEAMIAALNGDEERILLEPSPISTNNTKYYNEILKDPEVYNVNNLELAKQYLDASGYDGEEITYLCSQGTAFYRIAMVVIPRLEQIGINVNLQVVDGGSHGGLRSDPTAGHDIGAWETQKAVSNPLESTSLVVGSSAGWWENEKKSELIKVMQTTLTGSDASVQAYNEFCELVKDEVPYIVFGTALSQTYIQPNVEIDYVGTYSYYWNSYFTD